MKKLFVFLLIFIGILYSGGLQAPTIVDAHYDIQYLKGRTQFVDFIYEIDIKGTNKLQYVTLEIILFDEYEEIIESFGREIKVYPKKVQTFKGNRMIEFEVADNIDNVMFDLIVYQKKY